MRVVAWLGGLGVASAQAFSPTATGAQEIPGIAAAEVEVSNVANCTDPSRILYRPQTRLHAHGLLTPLLRLQEVTVDNGWDSSGWTTYRVYITLDAGKHAKNCYSIFGQTGHDMIVPPARQVPAPFGAHVGGVSPVIAGIPGQEQSKYDSWLTVGVEDGNPGNVVSSIGIDFDDWSATTGLTVDDGAVFWMDPDGAPDGRQLVAQLTLPSAGENAHSSANRTITFAAQGRLKSPSSAKPSAPKGNWKIYGISAVLGGKVEPPVDCEGDWGDWGDCNVCGDHGQKTRTYRVTQPAANGGQDCPFTDAATQHTACKPDERPCPPTEVPHHAIRCHSEMNHVVTTTLMVPATGGSATGGKAIFDFVLESAQTVTIANQLPKDCPSLQLFEGTNTSAEPLIEDHNLGCGHYDPLKGTLEAGKYTVVATIPLRRTSQVKLTTFCREPSEPVLNPNMDKAAAHTGLGGDGKNPSPQGNSRSPRPWESWWALPVGVCAAGLLVALSYLCVMKRANGSLAVSKRRRDLDEQLDSGLDADFDEPRFSTQNVQSISGTRQSYAE